MECTWHRHLVDSHIDRVLMALAIVTQNQSIQSFSWHLLVRVVSQATSRFLCVCGGLRPPDGMTRGRSRSPAVDIPNAGGGNPFHTLSQRWIFSTPDIVSVYSRRWIFPILRPECF